MTTDGGKNSTSSHEVLYTSDRGDRFVVSDMETSHLVNLIAHHSKQIEALDSADACIADFLPNITQRIRMLQHVLRVLIKELETREVHDDEYLSTFPPAEPDEGDGP